MLAQGSGLYSNLLSHNLQTFDPPSNLNYLVLKPQNEFSESLGPTGRVGLHQK